MTEIVKAGPEDYNAVLEMAKVIWPHTYSSILSAEQLDFMFEMMYNRESYNEQLLLKNHHYLLAKQDGRYVGFASYEINYLTGIAKIHKLYVLPDVQGSGTGKLLVAKIENIARAHNNTTLTLNVNRHNPAVHFYLKSGFIKAGQEDISIGQGYFMEDFIMQKEL